MPGVMNSSTIISANSDSQQEAASEAMVQSRAPGRKRILWAKRLLPVGALALLGLVALWPELQTADRAERMAVRQLATTPSAAQMTNPHYRSVDQRGHPYTITASQGVQTDSEHVHLAHPIGDVTLSTNAWLLVRAKTGVLHQRDGMMDLSGDAQIYRSDGTNMISDTAIVDTKQGVATSTDLTHAEGAFGTLDAQGFAMLDKGGIVQFTGPAHAVLRGVHQTSQAKPNPDADAALPPAPPSLPSL